MSTEPQEPPTPPSVEPGDLNPRSLTERLRQAARVDRDFWWPKDYAALTEAADLIDSSTEALAELRAAVADAAHVFTANPEHCAICRLIAAVNAVLAARPPAPISPVSTEEAT